MATAVNPVLIMQKVPFHTSKRTSLCSNRFIGNRHLLKYNNNSKRITEQTYTKTTCKRDIS